MSFDVHEGGRDKLVIGSGSDSGNSSNIVTELTGQVRSGIQHASFENSGWISFITDHDRSNSPHSWSLQVSAAKSDGKYASASVYNPVHSVVCLYSLPVARAVVEQI